MKYKLTPNRLPKAGEIRRGVVLFAVLLVVSFLALIAYRFNDNMVAEYRATDSAVRLVQARAIADSGVAFVLSELAQGNIPQAGTVQSLSLGKGKQMGTFELLTVDDESAKWNINALLQVDPTGEILKSTLKRMQVQVPTLADNIIDSIVDWVDNNDTPGEAGAENEYYNLLQPPYYCKNGPLDSINELLLVKGVSQEILFGDAQSPGLASFFTVYSREQNLVQPSNASTNAWTPKVNVNNPDLATMQQDLNTLVGEQVTNFIMAYRLYGASKQPVSTVTVLANLAAGKGSSSGVGGMASADYSQVTTELSKKIQEASTGMTKLNKISNIMDLVSKNVDVKVGEGKTQKTVTFPSPLKDPITARQYLPLLYQSFSTSQDLDLPGKLNLLTAQPALLAGLPSLMESDLQNIVGFRPSAMSSGDPLYQSPTWLFTEANMDPTKIRSIERYITGYSTAYRVRIMGKLDGSGPMSLMEVVVDTSGPRPRVVYFRDLSEKARQAREAGADPAKLAGL